jgi:PIN domain nuclease of toxin-antitoxin system
MISIAWGNPRSRHYSLVPMILLLDTHLLLWAAGDPERLPRAAHDLLLNPDNEPWFSAVSLWEITIKSGLDRPDFRVDPALLRRGLLDHGYTELSVTGAHALAVAGLPDLHKDPFDRLLVAQAQVEGILLLTHDPLVARYPGPVRHV